MCRPVCRRAALPQRLGHDCLWLILKTHIRAGQHRYSQVSSTLYVYVYVLIFGIIIVFVMCYIVASEMQKHLYWLTGFPKTESWPVCVCTSSPCGLVSVSTVYIYIYIRPVYIWRVDDVVHVMKEMIISVDRKWLCSFPSPFAPDLLYCSHSFSSPLRVLCAERPENT